MSLGKRIVNRLRCLTEGPRVQQHTVVQVVRSDQRERMPPAFIIGAYRSGTTLLRYVLDSHSRIAVPPESNFLLSLAGMESDAWMKKGYAAVGVDEAGLLERLRGFARDIFDDYAQAKGKARWIDKTPGYTSILPFIDRLFGPQCRYIMLYRHGLDVANSMAERYENDVVFGPAKTYVDQAGVSPRVGFSRYWVHQCERILAFEEAHPGQCFRLRYEDYAADPERWLRPLFAFLGEEWQPGVLDYHKQPHDAGLQDHKVTEGRGFRPAVGKYHDWSRDDLDGAVAVAGEMLARLGYKVSER